MLDNMNDLNHNKVRQIYERLDLSMPEKIVGIDAFIPIIERMREDGAVVVIKFDGQRSSSFYTAVVSGGPLKDKYHRVDTHTVEEALIRIVSFYDTEVWKTDNAKL